MSKDDSEAWKEKFDIGSDRDLDSLSCIPSLQNSQSTLYNLDYQSMRAMKLMQTKPGTYDPPHHSHEDPMAQHGEEQGRDQTRSPTRQHPPPTVSWISDAPSTMGDPALYEDQPRSDNRVKKLRHRDSSQVVEMSEHGGRLPPTGMERQYSDAYLESNLRTPRYNTELSYHEMVDQLAEGDPFQGEYKPSGKSKKSKHKKSKMSMSETMDNSSLQQTLDDPLPQTSKLVRHSSRKSKKKKRAAESVDSAGTYTVDGVTNLSYSNAETQQGETSSVKSNGTYTLKQEGSKDSAENSQRKADSKKLLKMSKTQRKSASRKSMRLTRKNINKEKFAKFMQDKEIGYRVPISEDDPGLVFSHERKKSEIWHYHTHTKKVPCDSFGVINFEGFGTDTDNSPYIRIGPDTQPSVVWEMMINQWHLQPPQLIISVTGGAKRFEMRPKLKERFKHGLINAAVSTGAWIITGGTRTGVMEFVGEAVRDHRITSGRMNDVVALGIMTWGIVSNRLALDGDDDTLEGLFPATYSKQDVISWSAEFPKHVALDENHSHFIMVDDGTIGKFGREITFRTDLEKFISQQQCETESNDSTLTIPVIMLIVEGGINSMKTVWQAILRGTPVLVLESSGRAADFIAHGYKITANRHDEEKSSFSKDFYEEMKALADTVFEWKEADQQKKPALIADCIKQLKESLEHRPLLTVFNLRDFDKKDFDRAILYALLKANRSNTNAQLGLALAWNRSDIARNEIFSSENRASKRGLESKHPADLKLNDAMATALIQDRLEFVTLFLENGINLKEFLDIRNLWNLYANCLEDESDAAAQLLNNRISFLKQTWGAYLCCKPVINTGSQPDVLKYVGKAIVHLLGDEALNLYADESYEVDQLQPVFGYVPKLNDEEDRAKKFRAYTKHSSKKSLTQSRLKRTYDFMNPERELFLWAILLNRVKLAKIFWRAGRDHIASALLASCLLKAMAEAADDEEEIELSLSLLEHSAEFETIASQVLVNCYLRNRDLAHQLLVRKIKNYGKLTLFMMAESNDMMDFMGQTCCQTKLNEIWKGRMAMYTSSFKILASIFLPFLIPAIKFTLKKSPQEMIEDTTDEFDDLLPEGQTNPPADHTGSPGGTRVAPEPDEKPSKAKALKHKLYKVQFGGFDGEGISVVSALYFFYTAPVTVFTCNVMSYLTFLALFSYFVLTDLHPVSHADAPSLIEYITWGWTVTMVLEEIRQILTKDQRSLTYKFRSWYGSVWNRFDFVMYMFFLTSVILRFVLNESNFLWARMAYSLTLAMYYIRFMQYFYVEKNIGPKVIMINKMLVDLTFFMLILIVFILSFGVTYSANLFPNSPPTWQVLKQVVYLPYWQMYGELFLENIEGSSPAPDECSSNETIWRYTDTARCPERNAIVPILLAGYMLITNILLVNLLIAMFSDTFQKVQDNSEKVWRFYRFSLVYEFYDRPTLIPPFIIINHVFRVVRYFVYNSTTFGSRFKYHNVFTDEDDSDELRLDDKDDARLLLFEKEAVEEYLHSVWSEENQNINNKVSSTAERLEKVIEELDSIKEQVFHQGQTSAVEPLTARSVHATVDRTPVEPVSARTQEGIKLEHQMDQLGDFVKQEVFNISATLSRLEKLVVATQQQQQQVQQRISALDITHIDQSEI